MSLDLFELVEFPKRNSCVGGMICVGRSWSRKARGSDKSMSVEELKNVSGEFKLMLTEGFAILGSHVPRACHRAEYVHARLGMGVWEAGGSERVVAPLATRGPFLDEEDWIPTNS